jgi:hypothetical protein
MHTSRSALIIVIVDVVGLLESRRELLTWACCPSLPCPLSLLPGLYIAVNHVFNRATGHLQSSFPLGDSHFSPRLLRAFFLSTRCPSILRALLRALTVFQFFIPILYLARTHSRDPTALHWKQRTP